MVVDDDKEFLEETSQMLRGEGYEILSYSNGYEALEQIKHKLPDLVMLDINMGEITGIQIAALIRYYPDLVNIPIILISGTYTMEDFLDKMKLCNIREFIRKPSSPEKIIETVRLILDRQ